MFHSPMRRWMCDQYLLWGVLCNNGSSLPSLVNFYQLSLPLLSVTPPPKGKRSISFEIMKSAVMFLSCIRRWMCNQYLLWGSLYNNGWRLPGLVYVYQLALPHTWCNNSPQRKECFVFEIMKCAVMIISPIKKINRWMCNQSLLHMESLCNNGSSFPNLVHYYLLSLPHILCDTPPPKENSI